MSRLLRYAPRTHPLLLAAAPALSLAAHNVHTAYIAPLVPVVAACVVAAGIAYAVLWRLTRQWERSALTVSLVIVLFLNYGRVFGVVRDVGPFSRAWQVDAVLGPLALCAAAAGIRAIWRTHRTLDGATRFVTVAAVVLVAYPALVLAQNVVLLLTRRAPIAERVASPGQWERHAPPRDAAPQPDVYYIVLDGYARADVLESVYHFDNSAFVDWLVKHGFFVADRSRSNYATTFLSLASSLNMRYVGDVCRTYRDVTPFYRMIQAPEIASRLKARGYSYVHINTYYGGTESSATADRAIQHPLLMRAELLNAFMRMTALKGLVVDVASYHLWAIERLRETARMAGPKFVFCHLLFPHFPHVFDEAGRVTRIVPCDQPWYPGPEAWRERDEYVGQLAYANRRVQEVLEEILDCSSGTAVIVLQADHGSASEDPKVPGGRERLMKERHAILNAYRVSDACRKLLYPTITPVNSFRAILSSFGWTDMALVPDRCFFSDYESSTNLVETTEDFDSMTSRDRATTHGVGPLRH